MLSSAGIAVGGTTSKVEGVGRVSRREAGYSEAAVIVAEVRKIVEEEVGCSYRSSLQRDVAFRGGEIAVGIPGHAAGVVEQQDHFELLGRGG